MHLTKPVPLALLLVAAPLLGIQAQRRAQHPAAQPTPPVCEPRIPLNQTTTPGDGDSHFRITQPGSYFLPRNVTVGAGQHGIEIESSDVSIDLMGFTLEGSPGAISGITVVGSRTDLEVRNGTVARFGSHGLACHSAEHSLFEGISVSENGGYGMETGQWCTVVSSRARSNHFSGFVLGERSRGLDLDSHENETAGFHLQSHSSVERCSSNDNGGQGFYVDDWASASDCTASSNAQNGFYVKLETSVVSSVANFNGNSGFYSNQAGVLIADCTAARNDFYGFRIDDTSTLQRNKAIANGEPGTGGGYYVVGSGNSLIGNESQSHALLGYGVSSSGNVLRGNVAGQNGLNWSIIAGNSCRVVAAATGGLIYGNYGGTAMGPSDPTANYTY